MQKTIWTRTALAIALCAPVLAQSGGASLAEVAQKRRDPYSAVEEIMKAVVSGQ